MPRGDSGDGSLDTKIVEKIKSELVAKLWSYFTPKIKSGNPVVFCFHQELVDSLCLDLFKKYKISPDGRKLIDLLCSSFYEIENESVQISENAFENLDCGFSSVILLVAQQVLAVEDMAKDHSLSEDAYFPRLRVRISSSLGERSLNPFEDDDFKKIWSTFQSEINPTVDSSWAITFYGGEGPNKYRSYPISQALLNFDDLFRIRQVFEQGTNKTITPLLIGELLRKEKEKLSKRGQRLIRNHALRKLVVDQLISFFEKPQTNLREPEFVKVKADRVLSDVVQVRAYLSSDDWLSDGYSLVLVDSSQNELTENDAVVRIRSILSNEKYLLLAKDEIFQDNFSYPCKEIRSDSTEKVLILFNKRDEEFVKSILRIYFANISSGKFEIDQTNLSDSFVISQLDMKNCTKRFIISDGRFFEKSSDCMERFTWQGGICVDHRSNVYLPGAPPEALVFGERMISKQADVIVNGISRNMGEVLKSLKNHIPFSFNLKIEGGREIGLNIREIKDRLETESYGFKLESSGNFLPIATEVKMDQGAFLFGFHTKEFMSVNPLFTLSRLQIAKILDQENKDWISIDHNCIKAICFGIDTANINKIVKELCKKKISIEKSAPKFVIDYLNPVRKPS